jgi:hypothetical protein
MKREDSLPCSQESAMGLYSEPDEFSLKIYLALFPSLGQGIQNISSLGGLLKGRGNGGMEKLT